MSCLNCKVVESSSSWRKKLIVVDIKFVKCCWVGGWIVINVIFVVVFWKFWFLWNFGFYIIVIGLGVFKFDFYIVLGGRKEFILVVYGESNEFGNYRFLKIVEEVFIEIW